jgi:hypothetical protein
MPRGSSCASRQAQYPAESKTVLVGDMWIICIWSGRFPRPMPGRTGSRSTLAHQFDRLPRLRRVEDRVHIARTVPSRAFASDISPVSTRRLWVLCSLDDHRPTISVVIVTAQASGLHARSFPLLLLLSSHVQPDGDSAHLYATAWGERLVRIYNTASACSCYGRRGLHRRNGVRCLTCCGPARHPVPATLHGPSNACHLCDSAGN